MRLATCPVHTPINSLSQFLQDRIVQFIVAFSGAPNSVAGVTVNALFLDDVSGVECIAPQLSSTACDVTHSNVLSPCLVPNKVRFSWGFVWGSTEQPCIIEQGNTVCMQPFASTANPTFVGFSTFTSHLHSGGFFARKSPLSGASSQIPKMNRAYADNLLKYEFSRVVAVVQTVQEALDYCLRHTNDIKRVDPAKLLPHREDAGPTSSRQVPHQGQKPSQNPGRGNGFLAVLVLLGAVAFVWTRARPPLAN
jgi:hypothetical protein